MTRFRRYLERRRVLRLLAELDRTAGRATRRNAPTMR
jgi:hypothetical protein